MAKDSASSGSGHPITVAVARLHEVLDDVAQQPAWALTGAETREALVALVRATTRAAELEARLLTHAEATSAGVETGATSTANWLANATHLTRRETHAKVRLATALATHPQTRDGVARAEVHPAQAMAIAAAVDTVPDDVAELCEKRLVTDAADHDADALKKLGRRVLEVVDPDTADAHEADLLDREEAAAHNACSFRMNNRGDGTVGGNFIISTRHAEMLKKAIQAVAAPKHARSGGGSYDHERPSAQRMGHAFVEIIESLNPSDLPDVGGSGATVVVTMSLATLTGGLAAASLDTGARISAGEARRLACQAAIIPAVLGTRSEVLDLGRSTRFHTRAQRIAVRLTQHHCQHDGCDVPSHLCHIHHTNPWSTGGHTNITDAVLLCPRHHAWVHRPGPAPDPPMRT